MDTIFPESLAYAEPIIHCAGFIASDANRVSRNIEGFGLLLARAFIGQFMLRQIRSGGITSALKELDTIDTIRTKTILIEAKSKWTLILSNDLNSAIMNIKVERLCRKLRCTGIVIDTHPTLKKSLPMFSFTNLGFCGFRFYDGSSLQNYPCLARFVRCTEEDRGKWLFKTKGEVCAFEDRYNYNKKRPQERLTPDILVNYLQKLGINSRNDAFFGDDYYLHRIFSLIPGKRNSLVDARRELDMGALTISG
jgi:hypothetical protein